MKCKEIYELMPDLAAGLGSVTPEVDQHLRSCAPCAAKLQEISARPWRCSTSGRRRSLRRILIRACGPPARREGQAASGVVAMASPSCAGGIAGVNDGSGPRMFRDRMPQSSSDNPTISSEPGTAVGDLQALDKNHDLYSDFDVLDDLQVQPDVNANP